MKRKILYGFLPIFLSLVVLLVPMRAAAAEPALTVLVYDDTVFLTNTYVSEYVPSQDGDEILPEYVLATYQGHAAPRLKLTLNEGCYYTGTGYFYVDIGTYDEGGLIVENIDVAIDLDSNMEGISYTITPDTDTATNCSYVVRMQFDNFCATNESMFLPFSLNITMSASVDNFLSDYVLSHKSVRLTAGDANLDVTEWDDLTATPGFKGDIAYLVQTVINENVLLNNGVAILNENVLSFKSAVLDRITSSANAIVNQVESSGNAIINKMEDLKNSILNEYDTKEYDHDSKQLSEGLELYNEVSDSALTSAQDALVSLHEFSNEVIISDGLIPSFQFVGTWFTNFWNIGGGLTTTFNASLIIFLGCFLLRIKAG